MQVGVEFFQAVQDRRHGIGHGFCIQDKNDRQPQPFCQIRAAAHALHRAVEQAHDPFRYTHICIGRVMVIEAPDMGVAHHIPVQVNAIAAGCGTMMDWIDEVRTAFERLYAVALSPQGPQQAQRKRGLTGAAMRCGDEELGNHSAGRYFSSESVDSFIESIRWARREYSSSAWLRLKPIIRATLLYTINLAYRSF